MALAMILIGLLGLMYFAYRGFSIILIAPVFAIIAALGSEHASMPVFSELYMTKAAEYIKTYYPIFLLGAIFATIMEKGGLAASVADKIISLLGKDRAILSVLLGCGVLTYGGLSVFVVAFVMYPFGAIIFKEANVPKRLLPATLWMGIFSYAMVSLPGTPQIQNIIPASYFGTTTWAGIWTGITGSVIYFVMAWIWIGYRSSKLKKAGEGYGKYSIHEPENSKKKLPSWTLSTIPLILVVVINLLVSNPFLWEWAYHWDQYSLVSFEPLKLSLIAPNVHKVQAIWSINIALLVSSIVATFIGRKRFRMMNGFMVPINYAVISSGTAVLNVASGYAFGCVVTSLEGFSIIKDMLLSFTIGDGPLVSAIITTNLMAAITGSASGGLTIALSMLGEQWLTWANQINMSPEILHRIVCMASVGIDPVPHCGALVTLLAICGLSHKTAYYDIAILMGMKFFVAFICLAIFMLTGLI